MADIYVGTPEAQRLHELFEETKEVIKRGDRLVVTFNQSKSVETKYRGIVHIKGEAIEIIHTENPIPEHGYNPTPRPNFGDTWEVEVITNWGWEGKQFALVSPLNKIS